MIPCFCLHGDASHSAHSPNSCVRLPIAGHKQFLTWCSLLHFHFHALHSGHGAMHMMPDI
jgi:hypothetical protein